MPLTDGYKQKRIESWHDARGSFGSLYDAISCIT